MTSLVTKSELKLPNRWSHGSKSVLDDQTDSNLVNSDLTPSLQEVRAYSDLTPSLQEVRAYSDLTPSCRKSEHMEAYGAYGSFQTDAQIDSYLL